MDGRHTDYFANFDQETATMEASTYDNQLIPPARCPECGQPLPSEAGPAPCPHCGFASDGSMLVLHGWASKRLPGMRLPRVILSGVVFCAIVAFSLQNAIPRYLGFSMPYVGALAITGTIVFLFLWPNRWPRISVGAPAQWHLRLSRDGFAARLGPGPVTWEPWSRAERVSVRRPRPGVCWIRIMYPWSLHTRSAYAVDLVVTCEDETIDQVRACIAAWREGSPAKAPSLASSSEDARTAARIAQGKVMTTLAIEQCPQCGYDLVGLPDKGPCPECGFEYDGQSLIVLYGWNGLGPGLMSPLRWVLTMVLAMFLASGATSVLGPRLGLPRTLLHVGLIYVLLAPVAIWSHYRRRSYSDSGWRLISASNRSIAWQLSLTPHGYGLRTGHGPCSLQPWSNQMYLHIDLKEGSAHRIRITTSPKPGKFGREWIRMDLDCDAATASQVLDRVVQWRQASR